MDKPSLALIPTGYKDGKLYSVLPENGVGDFNVVRGSGATRVNKEGLVEDVRILSGELVTNGDFSNGSTDWALVSAEASVLGGKLVCDNVLANTTIATQTGTAPTQKSVILKYDIIVNSGVFRILLGSGGTSTVVTTSGTYTFYETSGTGGNLNLQARGGGFDGSIDNISVKEVTEDTNIPRLDYTGGGCPSLLLEPLSTNLIVNSELNNVEDIVVSAVSHTISFYGAGSVTLSGAHTATLSGTGANDRVSLTFTPSAGTLTCTDSGSVDMKQVEALSYATSYIPTSGAIASRLADLVTGAGDATTFNSTEGVLYAEMATLGDDGLNRVISISDGTIDNRVSIVFGTSLNQIRCQVNSSSGVQFDFSSTGYDFLAMNKVAISYKLNDFSMWINGTKVETSTSGGTPVGLNELSFNAGDTLPFYGRVKDLRTYNTALTDLELTELTTI